MFKGFMDALSRIVNAVPQQVTTIPYPEEAPDYGLNLTGDQLLQKFFASYYIPEASWPFWRTVTIVVDKNFSYPAGMISQTKTLTLRPEYANPGILAHEFSHLSYAQLTEEQKTMFQTEYQTALQTDDLLKLLYSQKAYMQASIVEAHGEVFRYLGNQMPANLKRYYPYLIG